MPLPVNESSSLEEIQEFINRTLPVQVATEKAAEQVTGKLKADDRQRLFETVPNYGSITAQNILDAGRDGFRGEDAIRHAADMRGFTDAHRRPIQVRRVNVSARRRGSSRQCRPTSRPPSRTSRSNSSTSSSSRSASGDDPPPQPLLFEKFSHRLRWLPAAWRARLFSWLPERVQRRAWNELGSQVEGSLETRWPQ